MKEIVVVSGKGGTGKTSITAAFAYIEGANAILADCDVDAANMHLLMRPDFGTAADFHSGELAVIDGEACIACGKCEDVCRFDAITVEDGRYAVDPIACEGCGYCARVCPVQAISNIRPKVGEYYVSAIKTGGTMAHARLGIGAENSGKLVARVKEAAREIARRENIGTILVDGAPGIGCPVISSLSGAHYAVLVTEPSVSGLHDLKRVHEVARNFRIETGCIINKSDINPALAKELKVFLDEQGIPLISTIPYDGSFTKSMIEGRVVMEDGNGKIQKILGRSWEKIKELTKIKS